MIYNMMYFRNISMRTSTNFYLFNLALADIIIILMGELVQIYTFAKTVKFQKFILIFVLLPMISENLLYRKLSESF